MAVEEGNTEKFALSSSQNFPAWLASTGGSIAFTTYQAGKLFFLSASAEGRLSVVERTFVRSMGVAVSTDSQAIALATQYQILRFDNVVPDQELSAGPDALYAPHAGWVTGDVDAHDIAWGANGRPLFVNTLFSCIATVSDAHSFRPVWTPSFISRLAAEDRCHLNGMAVEGGQPRYVTAVSQSDVADGWRDGRVGQGIVIDVPSNEIVARGLSMPHSPRLYKDRLWLLNSGTGEFGFIDAERGRFEVVAFCPGYARGLAFMGGCAVIGLSLARENETFSGLPLDDALQARQAAARCGLAVIELERGDMVGWVRIEGVVRELYDVASLPNAKRPALIGFKGDEIRYVISISE